MNCETCNKLLVGKQSKFCSVKCKNSSSNIKHQKYELQQTRGKSRKLDLIKLKGNQCEICSYNKNYAALVFHHLDPKTKSFELDLRKCSNSKWTDLLIEAAKCQLLCSNCHAEVHNPNCLL
jgi:hypothetical protein